MTLVMMSFLSLYLLHLRSVNESLINLRQREKIFEKEAEIILSMKCELLNNNQLDSSCGLDESMQIIKLNDRYRINYNGITLELKVVDNKIYDYELIAFDK